MPSRNRGRKKPKLADISRSWPSKEEIDALHDAQESAAPTAKAIIGAVLVEHELDVLLRSRFLKQDDETWQEMTSDRGPLGTFSAKIILGYAFGLYDEDMRHNLDVVRQIRNAVAHSRRLIDFDHEAILRELSSVQTPEKSKLKQNVRGLFSEITEQKDGATQAYTLLCGMLCIVLLRQQIRRARRGPRRKNP